MQKKQIMEKKLGITGDYQYNALRGRNYLQANWHNNKLSVIDYLIKKYSPQNVLDLGTGSGNFELEFAKKLKNITGIDYNEEASEFLEKELKRREIKNVKVVTKDFAQSPDLSKFGKFDMIILIDVLEHIEINSVKNLVNNFKKSLNKKGKVVIVTPNYSGLWPILEKSIDRFTNIPHLENMQHITKFNESILDKVFRDNGFKKIYGTTFNTFSYFLPSKQLSKYFVKWELSSHLSFGNLLLGVFGIK